MKRFLEGLIEFFEWFDEIRDRLEQSTINFAAGIVPYFSSLIPAYFVFVHLKDMLFVPGWLAFVFAVVVEVLGFASINTFVTLYQYRQKYAESTTKGSVSPYFAVFSSVMYLIVIILVNGVLGIVDAVDLAVLYENWSNTAYVLQNLSKPIATTFSVFILSLLTIPGAVVVVARTQHAEFTKKHTKKVVRSNSALKPKKDSHVFKLTKNHEKLLSYVKDEPSAFDNISELSRQVSLSRPTLMKYKEELEENGYIRFIDGKVEVIKE